MFRRHETLNKATKKAIRVKSNTRKEASEDLEHKYPKVIVHLRIMQDKR